MFELSHLYLTLPQSPLHCLNFLFSAVSHSWSHINMQGRKTVMSLWGSHVNIWVRCMCVYQAGSGTAPLERIANHDPQLKALLLFLFHKSQVWPQEALSPALFSCLCLYLGLQPERWSAGVGLLGNLNCRPFLWFGPYIPTSLFCAGTHSPPSVFYTLDWSQSLCGKVWTNNHPEHFLIPSVSL